MNHEIANAIIAGFTGQLQGWWYHIMILDKKLAVMIGTTTTANGEVFTDIVNMLVYTILIHFVGSTRIQVDRSQEQLLNLRCLTLSHFKWYSFP